MHSFRASTENAYVITNFIYHGDLSGEVKIVIESNGRKTEYTVVGEHILQFVANYIRQKKIEAIEEADDDTILGL